jgi:hypothetical protein
MTLPEQQQIRGKDPRSGRVPRSVISGDEFVPGERVDVAAGVDDGRARPATLQATAVRSRAERAAEGVGRLCGVSLRDTDMAT